METSPTTLLLLALLLVAVTTDLRSRRIPNTLVLTGTTLALASHALVMGHEGVPLAGPAWWAPLAGLITGLLVLMPLYLMRAMGAGDVKLMATVGAFVGAPTVLSVALYTLLAGGLLSLTVMFATGVAAHTLANLRFLLTEWMARALRLRSAPQAADAAQTAQTAQFEFAPLQTTAARLPYALAISAGTVAALLKSS
jgi:prepilin peptidase CpaA